MKQSRRKFISTIAAAGAAIPLCSIPDTYIQSSQVKKFPVRMFSKPIDNYDFGFMCECLAESGIGGFDLTLRPGGKVEPANVETVLPELTEEAKKYNLVIDMLVTGIISVTDPLTERILKSASSTGIKYYRLGWFDYDLNIDIRENIRKYRMVLKELVELNRHYGLHGGYQNHAGTKVGGPVWDLKELLKDLPPEFIGVQYDVRHAMVEGANTWILGLIMISDHIRTLAVKDFTWKSEKGKIQAVTVPLGEGMVNWDLFFKTVKELDISGPVTLHVEYPLLDPGDEKLPLLKQQSIIVRKLRKDMDFLNSFLVKYQLL